MEENRYIVHATCTDHMRSILDGIRQTIIDYGCATIEDMKILIGYASTAEDKNWGWVNLPEVQIIEEYPDGAIDLSFPVPVPLGPGDEPKEMVDHPSHYQSESGLEAWDVIEAFTSDLNGVEAFDTGNVLKYMCRWKKKNGLEDLKKAKRYLDHLINHVEKILKEND